MRANPILPLDIYTASMMPSMFEGIEKTRQKIARGLHPKRKKAKIRKSDLKNPRRGSRK